MHLYKIVILLLFAVMICPLHAQKIQRHYHYTNFDDSQVSIEIELTSAYLEKSNRNWFELIPMSNDPEKNYFAMIKAMFNNERDSLRFMFDMFKKALPSVSDTYFINTVIRFIQDIPYKIPPSIYKGKVTSGIFPPVICLTEGYGDCDTKSLLLCCILGHKYELIFLTGARHAFIGIKQTPQMNHEYVEINGQTYVLCEMTYPWDLGTLPISSRYDINQGKYKYITLKY